MVTPRPERARHRGPASPRPAHDQVPDQPAVADAELDTYLAALSADVGPDASELTGRFGSAQVFALRLPALRIEQLRRIATERGVSPGSLAVDWVIERLDREDTPTGPFPAVPDVTPPADVSDEPRRRGRRWLGRR